MYKKAQSAFWTAEELDLSKDANDWSLLSDNDRDFATHFVGSEANEVAVASSSSK